MPVEPKMIDLVSAFMAMLATFGITITADMSAYSILVLAATGGAVWSLINQQQDPNLPHKQLWAIWFVVGRVGLVVMIGAMLVNIISSMFGVDTRNIVGPVGGFVAAVGGNWFIELGKGILARRAGHQETR